MLAFFKHTALCMGIMTESLTYLLLIFFYFYLKQPDSSVDPALLILLAMVPTKLLYKRPTGVPDPLSLRWLTPTFKGCGILPLGVDAGQPSKGYRTSLSHNPGNIRSLKVFLITSLIVS